MHGHGRAALDQWGKPAGWIGRVAGHVMAVKNSAMNRAAIAHLDLRPNDRVLEIGFGPGKAIRMVAGLLADGFIAGLDHSAVMVRQAAYRNRKWIRAGVAEVRSGDVAQIPHGDDTFDKVFAVNSFHYWPAPESALSEIHRVLRPGGTLVLTIRAVDAPLRFDITDAREGKERVERARSAMAVAGFQDVSAEWRKLWRVSAVCVVARKAPPPPGQPEPA